MYDMQKPAHIFTYICTNLHLISSHPNSIPTKNKHPLINMAFVEHNISPNKYVG